MIVYILSVACLPSTTDAFITNNLSSLARSTISIQQQRSGHTTPTARDDNSCLHASPTSGSGFGSTKKKKSRSYGDESSRSPAAAGGASTELFELQELRAQLQTILKQDLQYQTLSTEKREELTKYVVAIVGKAQSPIDFSGKVDKMGTAKFVAGVEGKSWRMVFSTDPSGGGQGDGKSSDRGAELPYGSTVVLRIGEFMGCEGTLDYVLKFSKQIMGLRELVAKSTCSVDVSSRSCTFLLCVQTVSHLSFHSSYFYLVPQIGPVNPGLFTFQYQDIKTNVFGMSNLPVGFFGLLKGRTTYIDTVWFDGERWIERNYLENGNVVYNVYARDESDEAK